MDIRIGVQLHPQHCHYDQLAQAAQEVDAKGFDTLWTWDHFYPLYGVEGAPMGADLDCEPPNRGAHFEGWTLLTAFACLTKKVELGILVTCNSYRNPDLLADMYRTVDHVSHGRAILGIGSGWYEKDYEEYGFEFGTAGSRLRDLGESLPRIKARLESLNPPPVRHQVPIMIGGGGEKVTLKLVARHATMWNFAGSLEDTRHKSQVLDEWCHKIGRDPKAVERTVLLKGGESKEILEQYLDMNVTHFILRLGYPFDLEYAEGLLAWRASR